MKKIITTKKIMMVVMLMISLLLINCSSNITSDTNDIDDKQQVSNIDIDGLPYEDLSQTEIDGLTFMREEEKLARDVYIYLYDKWSANVFSNISNSEQTHTDAVKALIEKYELTDPVATDTPGLFINDELQELYNTLVTKGELSLIDALLVGALIEEVDIIDIQVELDDHVDNQDIVFVYDNLLNGSYNHLRAFTNNLSRQGVDYEPQLLPIEVYNDIVNNN